MFGGTDGKTPLKDLHILDTSSNTWVIPALHGEGPDAREGHSAASVGKRLFIFGGCGKSSENQEVYYNDLYILDTETLLWERAETSGIPPSARDSHTSSSWKNKIIVLGGEDSSDSYLSDVHMLDTDTLVWKQVCTSGQMLAPRAGHTTVALGSDLFVFGGFTDDRNLYDDLHVLNVDTGLWSRVSTVDQGPSARFSVAGDCLDEGKGILVFIGGCNKDLEALDDMYYLHTDIQMGNGQSEQRQKYSLKKELKRKCQENHLPHTDVPKLGVISSPSHPVNIQECNQSGTKTPYSRSSGGIKFGARIMNANQHGYAIKTVIDGKLLHGMLFSCTSSFVQDNHADSYKKRMVADGGGAELNKYLPILKAHTASHQQLMCSVEGHTGGAHGKEPIHKESPNGLALNLISSSPDADVCQPNSISGNLKLSFSPVSDPMIEENPTGSQKCCTIEEMQVSPSSKLAGVTTGEASWQGRSEQMQSSTLCGPVSNLSEECS